MFKGMNPGYCTIKLLGYIAMMLQFVYLDIKQQFGFNKQYFGYKKKQFDYIKQQAELSRTTHRVFLKFPPNSQLIPWLLRCSIINILRTSSIVGRLNFEDLKNIVWSSKLKFKFEYDPIKGC